MGWWILAAAIVLFIIGHIVHTCVVADEISESVSGQFPEIIIHMMDCEIIINRIDDTITLNSYDDGVLSSNVISVDKLKEILEGEII